ncbi:cobyrinate a,c-diamide synthase [Sulfuracidifex tepidarius]|uniref:Cobyrinate a,c-diamide synthase n=1 Tax=Sulfuracidifex tepidarius TaxID=1294262 RepID=A0A510DVD7_9CREN|nr:cobyrinate a,c-diamide synthase [Sulfuracidifex tepidarius]BBG24193.1 Cobyrinate a,c-diamide synthase [Sulfuracidifex tepidarius]BBG26950.1 Cobyrinate a,c-diamide synthase [Sulfuracidifex tepidarius]
MKRFIIASDRSGSGKTTVTAGIVRAISKRMRVRAFKAGPDFIDPGYLTKASREATVNLDLWMMGNQGVVNSLSRYSRGYDVSIIEGVMGLYDGINTDYSTATLSKVTKTPVILVINCSNVSSTVGAIIEGLKSYGNVDVRGVIFNKVGSETHYNYCKNSVPEGVKVLGRIPFSKDLEVNSRHLGLVTVEDNGEVEKIIERASSIVEENLDLELLLDLSESDSLPDSEDAFNVETRKTLAIAYDEAFSFYYKENLDLLKRKYNLVFFSPLENEEVQNADAIYLGGGYPELHMDYLERNSLTKKWIKESSLNDVPILAECGGMMYLSSSLVGERKYAMTGVFDMEIKVKDKLTIGYTRLKATKDIGRVTQGSILQGHEFHVSSPLSVEEKDFAFENEIGKGIFQKKDGVVVKNTLGTYSHFHFSNSGTRTVVF